MNMFARFDENPAMTLQAIKETKRNGRTDRHTDARTDGHVKTVYPPQTKFVGGIINKLKMAIMNNLILSKYDWHQTPSCICLICLH